MANISSLTSITTTATALSNLILVSPKATQGYQPQNPTPLASQSLLQQPPAFLFHYEGEQTIQLKSDITDHYIEDNTAIQDQIALKPVIVNTHGFIGELNNIPPAALAVVKQIADKLLVVGAYTPVLTVAGLIAYNEAFFLYQVAANAVNSAIAAWSSIPGLGGGATQNKQQKAFQLFFGYWSQRTLFTVQTPWGVFDDMAIDSMTPIQDAATMMISEFQMSFKKMNFASTQITPPQVQTRLGSQSASLTDLGTQTPRPGPSLLGRIGSDYPSLTGGG